MESVKLLWGLLFAPYAVLAVYAAVRVLACNESLDTMPWVIKPRSKAAKIACYALLTIAAIVAVVALVNAGVYFAKLGTVSYGIMVAVGLSFIMALVAVVWVYLMQVVIGIIGSAVLLFYYIALYFKK
ncbi:MAG: hypothetical protein J6T72_02570 [Alphaproteobacteria bacterium]|nr:hypothetical protein [Alphaproteobacteria bacterium]